MSVTTINQAWRNNPTKGQRRTFTVTLTVSGADLTADEIAALTSVVEAIETYVDLLADPASGDTA